MDNVPGKIKRGVYFLSNDRIFDLTKAFLNSFRKFNPDISLCLIPYKENIDRLRDLQKEYNFSIYSNNEAFNICDDICTHFHKNVYGEYRKLSMWEGDFDEFVYIDTDTVVLSNIDFVFSFLSEYEFVFSHSDIPHNEMWVWKKSVYDTCQLTKEQIAFSASTGFIASRKGALTLDVLKSRIEDATELSPYMNFHCREQAFLNYVIVTSGKKYTSLHVLALRGIFPDIKTESWAGEKSGIVKDGQIYFKNKPNPVLLLHWAGKWQPFKIELIVFSILLMLHLRKKGDMLVISYFMPYRKLWRYYRYLRENSPKK
jgi:hypothetical protein